MSVLPAGAPERWSVATPTEEVHLIAAPFTEYSRDAGAVKAMAFLRKPEQALADRYLDATAQYLEMYRGLLGPYPYSKFALVENFWETGYGMPSFTLLGEQIIRFPFILYTSYPHELLHNWWGNGVFVDIAGGNWCEGLTAYLADHLIAEQRGQGADHRRAILQKVTNYVTPQNDFPLSRFHSRHDAVTEAVGYGKTAMVFNMLREKVGDAQFIKALQAFYRDNRFREASFDDIRTSFEAVSASICAPTSISGSRTSERRNSNSTMRQAMATVSTSRSLRCSPGACSRWMFPWSSRPIRVSRSELFPCHPTRRASMSGSISKGPRSASRSIRSFRSIAG